MMSGQAFSIETIQEALRREGQRITQARRNILRVLFEADRPLTLSEIEIRAGELGRRPNYATVFRTISALEQLNIVHKVSLQRSCSYFELHDPSRHYDHLVCRECGTVRVLEEPCTLNAFQRKLAKRYGFSGLGHSLEFFGTCPECAPAPPRK